MDQPNPLDDASRQGTHPVHQSAYAWVRTADEVAFRVVATSLDAGLGPWQAWLDGWQNIAQGTGAAPASAVCHLSDGTFAAVIHREQSGPDSRRDIRTHVLVGPAALLPAHRALRMTPWPAELGAQLAAATAQPFQGQLAALPPYPMSAPPPPDPPLDIAAKIRELLAGPDRAQVVDVVAAALDQHLRRRPDLPYQLAAVGVDEERARLLLWALHDILGGVVAGRDGSWPTFSTYEEEFRALRQPARAPQILFMPDFQSPPPGVSHPIGYVFLDPAARPRDGAVLELGSTDDPAGSLRRIAATLTACYLADGGPTLGDEIGHQTRRLRERPEKWADAVERLAAERGVYPDGDGRPAATSARGAAGAPPAARATRRLAVPRSARPSAPDPAPWPESAPPAAGEAGPDGAIGAPGAGPPAQQPPPAAQARPADGAPRGAGGQGTAAGVEHGLDPARRLVRGTVDRLDRAGRHRGADPVDAAVGMFLDWQWIRSRDGDPIRALLRARLAALTPRPVGAGPVPLAHVPAATGPGQVWQRDRHRPAGLYEPSTSRPPQIDELAQAAAGERELPDDRLAGVLATALLWPQHDPAVERALQDALHLLIAASTAPALGLAGLRAAAAEAGPAGTRGPAQTSAASPGPASDRAESRTLALIGKHLRWQLETTTQRLGRGGATPAVTLAEILDVLALCVPYRTANDGDLRAALFERVGLTPPPAATHAGSLDVPTGIDPTVLRRVERQVDGTLDRLRATVDRLEAPTASAAAADLLLETLRSVSQEAIGGAIADVSARDGLIAELDQTVRAFLDVTLAPPRAAGRPARPAVAARLTGLIQWVGAGAEDGSLSLGTVLLYLVDLPLIAVWDDPASAGEVRDRLAARLEDAGIAAVAADWTALDTAPTDVDDESLRALRAEVDEIVTTVARTVDDLPADPAAPRIAARVLCAALWRTAALVGAQPAAADPPADPVRGVERLDLVLARLLWAWQDQVTLTTVAAVERRAASTHEHGVGLGAELDRVRLVAEADHAKVAELNEKINILVQSGRESRRPEAVAVEQRWQAEQVLATGLAEAADFAWPDDARRSHEALVAAIERLAPDLGKAAGRLPGIPADLRAVAPPGPRPGPRPPETAPDNAARIAQVVRSLQDPAVVRKDADAEAFVLALASTIRTEFDDYGDGEFEMFQEFSARRARSLADRGPRGVLDVRFAPGDWSGLAWPAALGLAAVFLVLLLALVPR